MTRDCWIPATIIGGFLLMLAVLGGFTWLAFETRPELVAETRPEVVPLALRARFEPGRLVVAAEDEAGHAMTALSVRGVALPPGGGVPVPLRFEGHSDGPRVAPWPFSGAGWRAEITARSGARVASTMLGAP